MSYSDLLEQQEKDLREQNRQHKKLSGCDAEYYSVGGYVDALNELIPSIKTLEGLIVEQETTYAKVQLWLGQEFVKAVNEKDAIIDKTRYALNIPEGVSCPYTDEITEAWEKLAELAKISELLEAIYEKEKSE